MNAIMIFQKIVVSGVNLMVSTFTNDLLVHAKQVNYFEMFLLSLLVESKNIIFQNKTLSLDFLDFKNLNYIKSSEIINLLNRKLLKSGF